MSTRPTEIVLLYDPVYDRKDSELTQILHKMDPTEAVYKRWFKAARHARASVGLCAQDYVWLRLSRLLEEQSEKDEERDDLEGEDQIQWDVRNVLSKYSIGLPRTDPNSALFNVTPKFLRLLQILKSCTAYGEAFRGIIFVQRRSVALSLVEILRIEGPTSFIRPDALVGSRESMRNQKDILRNFALGTCNLLVATKRAEDLDLPKATFIIRYDLFESQISQAYILSRTRGQESHVVYMIERGNDSHRRILSALTEVSPDVRQWTEAMRSQGQRTMPPPYLIETSDPYHSQSEDEEMEEESACVVTDPKLPLFEFRSIMDEQDPLAVECTINLPGGSQLRFSGPPSSSAAEARLDGILDYSLFPQRDMEPEGGTKCYPRKTPDFWNHVLAGTERVLYPLVVYFVLDTPTDGPYAPMAILTRRPLPSFSSFRLYGGVDCQVQFQQGSSIHVSEEEFLNLHKFTLRLSRGVSNRAFQVDPWNQRYLYAPLRADWTPVDELLEFPDIRDDINWHGVEQGSADQWASPLPFGLPEVVEADIEDIVIQDRSAEYTRRYTVKGVRGDLNPLSKPEDSPREAAYDNLLHYIRERHESQCLVEVESIPQVMNLLNPSRTSSTKIPAKTVPKYLIPELCFNIFRTGNLMPSVMQRIDEFLLVKELNARFFDNSINEKLLHMAICAPSHNSDTNYERLELLGDAFLKYLSSMYVFVTSPTQSEHSMHMSRQKIISNKALLIHSSRAGLPTYIQSRPFPVKLWLPPGYIVDMEKRSSDKGSSEVDKNVEEGEIKEEDPPAAVQESQFTDIAPEGSQSTAGPPSSQATAPEETLVPQASIDSIALDDQPSFTVDSLAEFPPSQDPEDSPESQNVSASQSGAKPGTTTKKRYFNKKKKLVDEDQTKLWLGDKAVADVAEAIIGAAYITGGREAALKATKALNIPVPNVDRWSDFGRKVLAPPPNLTAKLKPGTIEAVERIVGRTYKHPASACPSSGYEATSYERLEFIGDAILDFLVIRYIFDREKDLDPGGLTLLKGAMVSNSALAALCVWSGLHEHLLFESIYLSSTIQEYITVIKNRQADEYAAAEREHRNPGQYWLEVEPPKALSDVVESIIGAMYLSENFSPDGAETIFDNLLKPFYEKHVTTSTLSQHPTKILFEMFQARGCQSFRKR
ncbi:hypothetical protein DL96DRAFT_1668523 [Flagelloscypha sp. PMI_526]|nr:hypothetical protein DL96DRAFT_1668523 [Flagelloscypha sp. PMI_526]